METIGLFKFMVVVALWLCISEVGCESRSFRIDYESGNFVKDGKPFNYVSGSIHYSRVHPDLWYDRLYKMKYAGLDAIQVYIPWNYHETEHGVFDFSAGRDVEKFIQTAHDLGLLVILRPGPYICAEWEFGGFPYWIIKDNSSIALRSSDPVYLKYVSAWYTTFLPKMRKFLYSNGGPIISVQVENEYGSFSSCDHKYTNYLLNLTRWLLVDDVVYFTTDGDGTGYLKCGTIPNTLTTVDFGAGSARNGYRVLNYWNVTFNGPFVNSEYYIGWLDIWGQKHAHVSAQAAAATLDEALKMRANVNMYMFHGGTNFGFTSGAPGDNPFHPVPTSYDYDAAISEAGDLTFKYYLLRTAIGRYKDLPLIDPPSNSTKKAYGKVDVTLQSPIHYCAPLLSTLGITSVHNATYPVRMESLDIGYGYAVYTHELTEDLSQSTLNVPGIRDRGYVIVNDMSYGILYRDGPTTVNIEGKKGDILSIVVENMGRVGYGSGILRGTKGIISNITIGTATTAPLPLWSMYEMKFDAIYLQDCQNHWLKSNRTAASGFTPSTYKGMLAVSEPADTFLRLDGWFKGHVEVNGFNVGRYWPVKGPQITLYVPSAVLKPGDNVITVTELESSPCSRNKDSQCYVEFVDMPEINGDVPDNLQSPMLFYGRHG